MSACGTEEQLKEAKDHIGKVRGVKDLGDITWYLSISCQYNRLDGQCLLSQTDYIMWILDEYSMADSFEVSTPMVVTDRDRWDDGMSELLGERDKKRYQPLGCMPLDRTLGSIISLLCKAKKLSLGWPIKSPAISQTNQVRYSCFGNTQLFGYISKRRRNRQRQNRQRRSSRRIGGVF